MQAVEIVGDHDQRLLALLDREDERSNIVAVEHGTRVCSEGAEVENALLDADDQHAHAGARQPVVS
jgi:hypothetical protein